MVTGLLLLAGLAGGIIGGTWLAFRAPGMRAAIGAVCVCLMAALPFMLKLNPAVALFAIGYGGDAGMLTGPAVLFGLLAGTLAAMLPRPEVFEGPVRHMVRAASRLLGIVPVYAWLVIGIGTSGLGGGMV